MGMGMGHDLDTHVPMTMGLVPMVPSIAMINISWGGGVTTYLLMLVTTIELLWGWLGMILMLVTTIELLWGWLGMIVVVRGDDGILITGHGQWWVWQHPSGRLMVMDMIAWLLLTLMTVGMMVGTYWLSMFWYGGNWG